jgi:hypothetical protein
MIKGCMDNCFGDRADWLGLSCVAASDLEAAHGFQTLEDRRRNKFVLDGPFKHSTDATYALVNHRSGKTGLWAVLRMWVTLNHKAPHTLQGKWTKS